MCGLAGFSLSRDERVDAKALAGALLLGIENRGRHATGAAFTENGETYVQKHAVTAHEFVPHLNMRPDVRVALLHTRYATQGSVTNNANNHPIDIGGIVGIHNGCLSNDDELFARLPVGVRRAKVDSEAIFATLYYGREKPTAALTRLRGSAAVAWLVPHTDPDLLHLARVEHSPLVCAVTEAGSFLFASTASALREAATKARVTLLGVPFELPEGLYLQVRHGQVIAKHVFGDYERRPRRSLTAEEKLALNVA